MLHSPHLISRKSFLRALDILFNIFDKVENYGLHATEGDLRRVGRILDVLLQSILSRQKTNPSESTTCPDEALLTISDLFKTFELLMLNHLVDGQHVVSLNSETFQSSTQRANGEGDGVELSTTEATTGAEPPPSLETNQTSSVAIFSFKARLYGSCANDFIANPVHVVLDHRSLSGSVDDTSSLSTSLNVPNNNDQDFPLPEISTSHSTVCVTGDYNSYNYTCYIAPFQNFTITHTCQGLSEQLTSSCPTVYIEPLCHVVDGSDTQFICQVDSFSLQDTQCHCEISPTGNRRELEVFSTTPSKTRSRRTVADTYDLRLVTVLQVVVEDAYVAGAVMRYVPADDLSLVSVQSLAVCFVLFGSYLLYSLRKDHRILTKKDKTLSKIKSDDEEGLDDNGQDAVDEMEEDMEWTLATAGTTAARQRAKRDLLLYLNSLLPSLFKSSVPMLDRIYQELYRHHRYLAAAQDTPPVAYACNVEISPNSLSTIWTLKQFVVQSGVLLVLIGVCHFQVSLRGNEWEYFSICHELLLLLVVVLLVIF